MSSTHQEAHTAAAVGAGLAGGSTGVRRRALMGWVGASALGGWAPDALSATSVKNVPLAPPAPPVGALREFLLMRGALDDRLVVGALRGQYYGVVEDALEPLFGVVAVTFSRWRPLGDGRWLSASFEHAYYTDLAQGEVMDTWRNPFTDETCRVPVWTSPAAARVLLPDLSFQFAGEAPPGMTLEDTVSEQYEQSGQRVMVERTRSALQRPAPALPYHYSELVTLRAPLSALQQPDAKCVGASNAFTAVSGWRPWQRMPAGHPGHLLAQGVGAYGLSLEALPPVWLAATRRLQPDWWSNPASRLEPVFHT